MIPLTGNVNLLAVRDDLDLTGNFSLRTNVPGKNKATWDSTTDLSLNGYRGNVLGQQYDIDRGGVRVRHKVEKEWTNHNGSVGKVEVQNMDPSVDSRVEFPDNPRATQCFYLYVKRDTYTDDLTSEARHFGYITESGDYKVQCYVNKKNGTGGAEPYSKIAVIQNKSGYLSGALTRPLDHKWGGGDRWQKYENTVTLDVAKPYVTVIVYIVTSGRGTPLRDGYTYYTALQLDKI